MVCLHVIKALEDEGYQVTLATDYVTPEKVETMFKGMGHIMNTCTILHLPEFRPKLPRFMALQRLYHARKTRKLLTAHINKSEFIFNTQTSLYMSSPSSQSRVFNVFYDPSDLFVIPDPSSTLAFSPLASQQKRAYYRALKKLAGAMEWEISQAYNIPLSKALEELLEKMNYRHSSYLYPPCDLIFKPRSKKKMVIQATRIIPHKRLEDFSAIARGIPETRFFLVGSISPVEMERHGPYIKKLLDDLPRNVTFLHKRIRDVPDVLEESKVYLYTSREPGINISTAQALGAGCMPVTPAWGGGAEIVLAGGVGYTYKTVSEGIEAVRKALDDDVDVEDLAERARIFSAENFEQEIRKLIH